MTEIAPIAAIPPEKTSQNSHFIGGFVIGMVLGTAGYYFLGTPEGKRLRGKLVTRWHKLAQAVEARQTGSKSDWSDRLKSGLQFVAKELGVVGSLVATHRVLPKARTTHVSASALTPQRSKTKTARSRAKFKGV